MKKKFFKRGINYIYRYLQIRSRYFYCLKIALLILLNEIRFIKIKNIILEENNYFQKTLEESNKRKNHYENSYNFNSMDAFSDNILIWSSFFDDYGLPFKSGAYLEIGCFEGRSSVFVLEKLKYFNCTFVDPFLEYDELRDSAGITELDEIYNTFSNNTFNFRDRIQIKKITSNAFFAVNKDYYDLIYIDGSHYAEDVYLDCINSFKFLNKGGLIIFDDFLWAHFPNIDENPITAILDFMYEEKKNIKIKYISNQVIVEKL
jgi:hypothetical protein